MLIGTYQIIAIDFLCGESILRIEQFVDSIGVNRTQTAAVDFFKIYFFILNRISKLCKHDQGGPYKRFGITF